MCIHKLRELIVMEKSCDDSETSYIELQNCERLSQQYDEDSVESDDDKKSFNRNLDELNSNDFEDNANIFGDDWIGKPGVSSESENDDFFKDKIEQKSKIRIKKKSMPSHVVRVEGDPVRYKCTICVKTFGYKGHISYHAYCDRKDKPYKCYLCSKSFSKKTFLNYHIRTHTGDKPYICSICDYKFYQLDKLKRHMRIHLGSNIKCNKCDATFRDTNSLNVHVRTHEEPNYCTIKCDTCLKTYKNRSILNKHIKAVHLRLKKFVCEHCGKGFDRKYTLVNHLRTHSGLRAFSCDQCNRTFKNFNDRNKHKLTHSDNKEYRCEVCRGTFKRRDNLIRHLRNIHPEAGVKKITRLAVLSQPSTSQDSSTNRISVIRIISRSYLSDQPFQQSVIKHSGPTASQLSPPQSNIRECVIKSTR